MPAGKDGKSVPENVITPAAVHFTAAEANPDTPVSLSGDISKNLPKTSTPYPKENSDHQLSISRIASAVEQITEYKDGPVAKRRREVYIASTLTLLCRL